MCETVKYDKWLATYNTVSLIADIGNAYNNK